MSHRALLAALSLCILVGAQGGELADAADVRAAVKGATACPSCTAATDATAATGAGTTAPGKRHGAQGYTTVIAGAVADYHQRQAHYVLKLFDEGGAHAQRPKSVLSVFVRAGQTAQLQVPLGSYVVRYAAGEKWYGYKHLFGPQTAYTEANEV